MARRATEMRISTPKGRRPSSMPAAALAWFALDSTESTDRPGQGASLAPASCRPSAVGLVAS
jgi:hypothetical protein